MQAQSLELCEQCAMLLHENQQNFKRVQFLRRLSKLSNNQKYKKSYLFLYCLYCIISKCDYVQALQVIQKSEQIDQGSMIGISICKMIRGLLYTFIDKHREGLNLLKQSVSLLRTVDSISLEMKNHYKRIIPLIINNINTSNGKKPFFNFFNQVYDQLAKQTKTNEINQKILYSIHFQIQQLKSQIDDVPTVNMRATQKFSLMQKSKSASKFNTQLKSSLPQANDYYGFRKPVTQQEQSIKNIQKMIQNQKLTQETYKKSHSPYKTPLSLSRKSYTKPLLKNKQNPYQMNFYADENPSCQFL